MSNEPCAPTSGPEPFQHLLGTRDIHVLWMLRILVHLYSNDLGIPDHALHRLNISIRTPKKPRMLNSSEEIASTDLLFARLAKTLEFLESSSDAIPVPHILGENLGLLVDNFGFSITDCHILALSVCMHLDNGLFNLADNTIRIINVPDALAKVLGLNEQDIAEAVAPCSILRRSCLIEIGFNADLLNCLRLQRGGLRTLGQRKFTHIEDFLNGILSEAAPPRLLPTDYPHLQPSFPAIQELIGDALREERLGVNVLLYGAPGTGKTELVRVLARELQTPLFNVAELNEDGDALNPTQRLGSAACGQFLLGTRKAILCFDEVESIFNDGNWMFGKPSTAESQKSAFNNMLEQNKVPTFWIANSIRGLDPAFARRFDLIVKLNSPPQKQRLQLLERECGELVPHAHLKKLSQIECITPGVVTRAASVVRRIAPRESKDAERLLETVLDGVLQAQRHPPLTSALVKTDMGDFVPNLCNASENLDALADGLSNNLTGRICLYGPPGTGKTAFGRWLAERLDKPLVLKRVSDIQSPFLGEMEQNLARAFAQAARDGAILQIDEVDSFLQDRRQAQRTWETSQVNEFLTQLENFDGLFIASTNLMDNLDQAALRRFDYKVRMDYLRHEQALALLQRKLDDFDIARTLDTSTGRRLAALKLVPGDFAVLARRHKVTPFADVCSVIDALCVEAEVAHRATPRSIGFV